MRCPLCKAEQSERNASCRSCHLVFSRRQISFGPPGASPNEPRSVDPYAPFFVLLAAVVGTLAFFALKPAHPISAGTVAPAMSSKHK